MIGVIIVNWQGLKDTLECIRSFKKTKDKNHKIVIVDNGSSPKEISKLSNLTKKGCKVITNNKNLGYPKATNIGIDYLLKDQRISHVLWINNDTQVSKDFFRVVKRILQDNPNIGMLGFTIHKLPDKKIIDTKGLYISLSGYCGNVLNNKNQTILPSGVAILFSRQALEAVKVKSEFLPSRYFLYCEDADIATRIILSGLKWMIYKKPLIFHKGSASAKKIPDMASYYLQRNTIWFVTRCFPTHTILKLLPFIVLGQLLSIIYYVFIKHKPTLIAKAKIESLLGLKETLQERRMIQSKKQIPAREFEKILQFRLF